MSPMSTAIRAEWSRRLARSLVAGGYIPETQVTAFLAEATAANLPLGTVLIAKGALDPPVVVNTFAQLARLPAVDLRTEAPDAAAARVLPPLLSQDHQAIAMRVVGRQLIVVFGEPPQPEDVRSLGSLVGFELVPALGDPVAIARLLAAYGRGDGNGHQPAAPGMPPAGYAVPGPPPPPPPQPPTPAPAGATGASRAGRSGGASGSSGGTTTGSADEADMPLHIDDLLRYAVSIGASDLHLTSNMPPTVRLHGALRPMEDIDPLDNTALREMIFGILPQSQRERFEADHELDTSHSIAGVGRFRVNVALQRGTIAVALRPIPHEIPPFESLGLPDAVRTFTELRRGLVLVTGPTGSGKSTSLASLIDIINSTKPLHIVTVEDPIEFLHAHKRSIISQREVGADTSSFSEALRRVLRQDPDVILVGELRDLETIATALTAAETGHLVFATLHTQDAPSTIDRVIDVFPAAQQDQIRIQLGSSLQGVVTQQLVPLADGSGRCVAAEVLVCTPAVQNLIRGAKTHQVYSLMQTGGQYGMQTMDQSLASLVRMGLITQGMAMDRCRSEEDFRNHLQSM